MFWGERGMPTTMTTTAGWMKKSAPLSVARTRIDSEHWSYGKKSSRKLALGIFCRLSWSSGRRYEHICKPDSSISSSFLLSADLLCLCLLVQSPFLEKKRQQETVLNSCEVEPESKATEQMSNTEPVLRPFALFKFWMVVACIISDIMLYLEENQIKFNKILNLKRLLNNILNLKGTRALVNVEAAMPLRAEKRNIYLICRKCSVSSHSLICSMKSS